MCLVVALLALLLRLVHQRENKKLERAEQATAEGRENSVSGWQMKTGFRYVY